MHPEDDPELEVSPLAPGGMSARRLLRILMPLVLIPLSLQVGGIGCMPNLPRRLSSKLAHLLRLQHTSSGLAPLANPIVNRNHHTT